MSRNPYAQFHLDPKIVKEGIIYEDEFQRINVTFAGPENTRYDKMLKNKLKPFDSRIKADNFPDSEFHKILAEVYPVCVIQSWEAKKFQNDETEDFEWVNGLYNEDGTIVEANEENMVNILKKNTRLLTDLQKIANNFSLYRQGQKEENAKN